MEELKAKIPLSEYKGMRFDMKDGSIIADAPYRMIVEQGLGTPTHL